MPRGRRTVRGCATMVARARGARKGTGSDVTPNRSSPARRGRKPRSVPQIGSGTNPWKRLHAEGKALRDVVPRRAHAGWKPAADRPDPLALIARSNADRQPDLVPIRMGRMASSVFGFYRGSAGVMASDLAHTPVTGIHVLMDGDAHLANFGLFGTVEQDVVFDLDDFDESQPGPWEWDVKRLVASVNVAARDLGWERTERRAAAVGCARAYRREIRRLERKGALAIWYEFLFTGREGAAVPLDPVARDVLRTATQTAAQRTSEGVLGHLAVRSRDGAWRFREIPPIQRRLPRDLRGKVLAALEGYARSLPRGRRFLLDRYRPVDVADTRRGRGKRRRPGLRRAALRQRRSGSLAPPGQGGPGPGGGPVSRAAPAGATGASGQARGHGPDGTAKLAGPPARMDARGGAPVLRPADAQPEGVGPTGRTVGQGVPPLRRSVRYDLGSRPRPERRGRSHRRVRRPFGRPRRGARRIRRGVWGPDGPRSRAVGPCHRVGSDRGRPGGDGSPAAPREGDGRLAARSPYQSTQRW